MEKLVDADDIVDYNHAVFHDVLIFTFLTYSNYNSRMATTHIDDKYFRQDWTWDVSPFETGYCRRENVSYLTN